MPTPQRTSLDRIVAAGRELLEASGPGGLTMQAVASKVGVRAPSLYKWVRDRDALLLLVATAVNEELAERLAQAPATVAGLARTYREFARQHPEGFRLIGSSTLPAESVARFSEPVLRLARDLVGEQEALSAARFLAAWTTGFITMELAGAFRLDGDLEAAFGFGIAQIGAALGERSGG